MAAVMFLLATFASIGTVSSFHLIHQMPQFSFKLSSHGVHDDGKVAVNSPKGNSVSIYNSPADLATALCNDFVLSAQNAITRSGTIAYKIHTAWAVWAARAACAEGAVKAPPRRDRKSVV